MVAAHDNANVPNDNANVPNAIELTLKTVKMANLNYRCP
jgi:hypothetical protein